MTMLSWLERRRAFCTWLVRGAIGFALLAVAMSTRESLVAIPAVLLALIAFRGCPMCWLFGIFERDSQDRAS
jgi:hypothetical protein